MIEGNYSNDVSGFVTCCFKVCGCTLHLFRIYCWTENNICTKLHHNNSIISREQSTKLKQQQYPIKCTINSTQEPTRNNKLNKTDTNIHILYINSISNKHKECKQLASTTKLPSNTHCKHNTHQHHSAIRQTLHPIRESEKNITKRQMVTFRDSTPIDYGKLNMD